MKKDDDFSKIVICNSDDLNKLGQSLLNQLTTSPATLKILSLNINSYLAHIAEFERLVTETQPHIISVMEFQLNPEILIALDDYAIIC